MAVTALPNAITGLVTAINTMQSKNAPTVHVPTTDPFESNLSFDLSSRAGASTYAQASQPLTIYEMALSLRFLLFLSPYASERMNPNGMRRTLRELYKLMVSTS